MPDKFLVLVNDGHSIVDHSILSLNELLSYVRDSEFDNCSVSIHAIGEPVYSFTTFD